MAQKSFPQTPMGNRLQTNLKRQDLEKTLLESPTAQSSLIASEVELAIP